MTLCHAPPTNFLFLFFFFFFFFLLIECAGTWQAKGKKEKKKKKKKEISNFMVSFFSFPRVQSELAHDCSCHSKAAGCALKR